MRPIITHEQLMKLLRATDYHNFLAKPFDKGLSTTVFKLSHKDETFFIKFYDQEEPIESIVLAHKKMRDQGIRVSEIVYFSKYDNPTTDLSYIIERAIPGQSLDSSKLDKKDLEKVLHDAGRELAIINNIPVKGVGWMDKVDGEDLVAEGMNYDDFALHDLEANLKILVNNRSLTDEFAKKLVRYINSNKHLLTISGSSNLSHGDFCSDHIYVDAEDYSGLIDFGDIRGTTKYHDLAHFYTYDRGKYQTLLAGYREFNKLDQDIDLRILTEAILFGIRKLAWLSEKHPERVKGHKVFGLFQVIF